jgi:hypothetical protein
VCWDDPVVDDPKLEGYNLDQMVDKFTAAQPSCKFKLAILSLIDLRLQLHATITISFRLAPTFGTGKKHSRNCI